MAKRKYRRRARRSARRSRRISAHQHKFGAKGRKAFDSCLKKVASGEVSATRSGWAGCFRKSFKSR